MIRLKSSFILMFLFAFALNSFFACAHNAHKEPANAAEAPVQIWELKLIGDTQGTLNLFINRIRTEKDTDYISGKLYGKIRDHRAGTGKVNFKFKGKIQQNSFQGSFNGLAETAIGDSNASGHIRGTIVGSQMSGTWDIIHALGLSKGRYTAKKKNGSM